MTIAASTTPVNTSWSRCVATFTNVPVMLDDYQTDNVDFGRTLNPWSASHSPGGSSGGAAAAIATGLSFGDLGSDLYGSIRMPAAWCGIYGHRPSNGVLSKLGHMPWTHGSRMEPPLSTVGPLAATASDLELVFRVLADAPVRAPDGASPGAQMKIGLWLDDDVAPISSSYRAALEEFADRLRGWGATVETIESAPVAGESGLDLFDRLMGAELSHNYAPGIARELAALAAGGSAGMAWARFLDQSSSSVWQAWEEQREITAAWSRLFENYDLVVAPAAHGAAPLWDPLPPEERTLMMEGRPWPAVHLASAWSRLTNVGMGPATVVPIGLDELGLPLGAQVLGPNFADAQTLSAASRWERDGVIARPSLTAWP